MVFSEEVDGDTMKGMIAIVSIMCIMGITGYALSLGMNHTLPSLAIGVISLIVGWCFGKGIVKKKQKQEVIQEDDEEGEA